MEKNIIVTNNIQEEQLAVLKEMSAKMDDLTREMREVKVRVSEISK